MRTVGSSTWRQRGGKGLSGIGGGRRGREHDGARARAPLCALPAARAAAVSPCPVAPSNPQRPQPPPGSRTPQWWAGGGCRRGRRWSRRWTRQPGRSARKCRRRPPGAGVCGGWGGVGGGREKLMSNCTVQQCAAAEQRCTAAEQYPRRSTSTAVCGKWALVCCAHATPTPPAHLLHWRARKVVVHKQLGDAASPRLLVSCGSDGSSRRWPAVGGRRWGTRAARPQALPHAQQASAPPHALLLLLPPHTAHHHPPGLVKTIDSPRLILPLCTRPMAMRPAAATRSVCVGGGGRQA